jgi:transcriptional regulator with XRE-family HTH domain
MLRHKAYGKRIRLLRDARCWTQQQLARAAGYSIKTIYKAEAGRALKRQTLADIARALGVQIEDIAQLPATPVLRQLASHPLHVPPGISERSKKVPTTFRHRS